MEVDPMASFKVGIGASSCYVLRSASECDHAIIDSLYPSRNAILSVQTDTSNSWGDGKEFSGGTYVVGILGQGTGTGAVNYYAMTPSLMESFRSTLMSNVTSLVGVTEITSELTKALFNPFQYVVSALWFPFTIGGGNPASVKLGWWDTGVSAPIMTEMVETEDSFFTVSLTPSGSGENIEAWMMLEPYSEYTLFSSPWGLIKLDSKVLTENIDPDHVGNLVQIEKIMHFDYISGMAYLDLRVGDVTIAYRQAMIGVNTILAQSTQDIIGGALNIAGGGAQIAANVASGGLYGMITGNNTIGALGQMYDGVKAFMPDVTTSGTNGGIGAIQTDEFFIVSRCTFPEFSIQENGRPLCKTKIISSLSGYIKTMNADIVLAGATDTEQEQVRTTMNRGFFYE